MITTLLNLQNQSDCHKEDEKSKQLIKLFNLNYIITEMSDADKFILTQKLKFKTIVMTGSKMDDNFFLIDNIIPVAVNSKSVTLSKKS